MRTDSTHVLGSAVPAAVRGLNRLERVGETLRVLWEQQYVEDGG